MKTEDHQLVVTSAVRFGKNTGMAIEGARELTKVLRDEYDQDKIVLPPRVMQAFINLEAALKHLP